MSAAMWPATRISAINLLYPDICPRCHQEPETPLHTFWTCPCNEKIDETNITKSNKYIKRAVEEADTYPCLWFRGLLPNSIIEKHQIPEPAYEQDLKYINIEDMAWVSGVYYGDASGGNNTSFKVLRRCGIGLVAVKDDGTINFGLHSNLPGLIQTVGRGELYALLLLVRLLVPLSNFEFVTDNQNVWRTFNGGPKSGANSANCDFYEEIFRTIHEKALKPAVRWMPSHLREKLAKGEITSLPDGITQFDITANDHADDLAGKAAEACRISDIITAPYIRDVQMIKHIQKRLTTIAMYLPLRDQKQEAPKPPVCPRITREALLTTTSHSIIINGNRYSCTVCKNSFSIIDAGCKHWLSTQCNIPSQEIQLYIPTK
jgi:predicted HD phosphohydrolase